MSSKDRNVARLLDRAKTIEDWPPPELLEFKEILPEHEYGLIYAAYADVRLSQDWQDVRIHRMASGWRPLLSGTLKGVTELVYAVSRLEQVTLEIFDRLFVAASAALNATIEKILLAIIDPDSTVAYYVLKRGIVKPDPNA
ncbi:tRNA splicing endonuclease subunit [Savitreella phatthalungensis]